MTNVFVHITAIVLKEHQPTACFTTRGGRISLVQVGKVWVKCVKYLTNESLYSSNLLNPTYDT